MRPEEGAIVLSAAAVAHEEETESKPTDDNGRETVKTENGSAAGSAAETAEEMTGAASEEISEDTVSGVVETDSVPEA